MGMHDARRVLLHMSAGVLKVRRAVGSFTSRTFHKTMSGFWTSEQLTEIRLTR
jgi:hypothetical protein